MRSSVEIYNIRTAKSRVVFQTEQLIEAPNFSPDGRYLLLNGDGLLYRLSPDGEGGLKQVDTGFAAACNKGASGSVEPGKSMLRITIACMLSL